MQKVLYEELFFIISTYCHRYAAFNPHWNHLFFYYHTMTVAQLDKRLLQLLCFRKRKPFLLKDSIIFIQLIHYSFMLHLFQKSLTDQGPAIAAQLNYPNEALWFFQVALLIPFQLFL